MMTTVHLDLNNPTFQSQLFDLEKIDRQNVMTSLKKLFAMTWDHVYRDKGLHWERILSKTGPNGEALYSLRLGRGFRAVAYRESEWLVLLTLHPDHDSTFR